MKTFIGQLGSKITNKLLKTFVTDDSFIVELCSNIFKCLGKISLRCPINKLCPATENSYRFVEWLVLIKLLLLSIVLLSNCSAPNVRWWEWIAIGFGTFFVCETVIYQINVTLFDNYRKVRAGKGHAVRSYRRTVILLSLNYLEIVFWFTLFYRNMSWAFETGKACLNSFPTALHFSLVTMTGFGNTDIFPTKTCGYVVTSIHMAIGLIMVMLILTTFISLIPKPKTKDKVELEEIKEFHGQY